MQLKIDMQILALEPQPNGLTLIEARAPDGTGLLITVRVAEPLAVGGWMTMALFAEPAAAATPASMRERMQVSARGMAAPATTRSAVTVGSAAAPASTGAPASAAGDASSLLLSSILGSPASAGKANLSDIFDNSPLAERNVDDEMDALLGAPRKG